MRREEIEDIDSLIYSRGEEDDEINRLNGLEGDHSSDASPRCDDGWHKDVTSNSSNSGYENNGSEDSDDEVPQRDDFKRIDLPQTGGGYPGKFGSSGRELQQSRRDGLSSGRNWRTDRIGTYLSDKVEADRKWEEYQTNNRIDFANEKGNFEAKPVPHTTSRQRYNQTKDDWKGINGRIPSGIVKTDRPGGSYLTNDLFSKVEQDIGTVRESLMMVKRKRGEVMKMGKYDAFSGEASSSLNLSSSSQFLSQNIRNEVQLRARNQDILPDSRPTQNPFYETFQKTHSNKGDHFEDINHIVSQRRTSNIDKELKSNRVQDSIIDKSKTIKSLSGNLYNKQTDDIEINSGKKVLNHFLKECEDHKQFNFESNHSQSHKSQIHHEGQGNSCELNDICTKEDYTQINKVENGKENTPTGSIPSNPQKRGKLVSEIMQYADESGDDDDDLQLPVYLTDEDKMMERIKTIEREKLELKMKNVVLQQQLKRVQENGGIDNQGVCRSVAKLENRVKPAYKSWMEREIINNRNIVQALLHQ